MAGYSEINAENFEQEALTVCAAQTVRDRINLSFVQSVFEFAARIS
jgi:hypothetical protein